MIAGNNKSCSRTFIVVVVVLTVTYLIFSYFNSNKILGDGSGSSDQSSSATAYKAKIIPASLDDDALNALPKDTFSYLAMIDAGELVLILKRDKLSDSFFAVFIFSLSREIFRK